MTTTLEQTEHTKSNDSDNQISDIGAAIEPEPKPKHDQHKWRMCEYKKSPVKDYVRHTHPSKKHPDGCDVIVHTSDCRANPSNRDELSYAEIQRITDYHFHGLSGIKSGVPAFLKRFAHGDDFDQYILGWTEYWNEVLARLYIKSEFEILDPNLAKALIASESSFQPKSEVHDKNNARGLMQITKQTREVVNNVKAIELVDYYLKATADQLFDPSANICIGIRWLFHKKYLLKYKEGNKRPITWDDAIANYKDAWEKKKEDQDKTEKMTIFHGIYDDLLS